MKTDNGTERPKVTVSVPVYNVEAFLPQCLDSLLSQTLRELEIILVDDGSPDGSGAICDEYARRDGRVRVFHKANGGLASARQVALEHASGEYYIVCDSDDWVEPSMYEDLYREAVAQQADMVICDNYYNYPDGRQVLAHNFPDDCTPDGLMRGILMRRFTGSSWNKLVRRELFDRYGLYWEEGIDLGEDVFMFLKLLQHPIKVVTLPKAYYHYRRILSEGSLTNKVTMRSFRQAEHIHAWKKAHIDPARFGRELFHSALDYAFIGIRAHDMDRRHYAKFVKEELPLRDFLKYRVVSPKSFLVLSSKLLGLPFAQWVCRRLYKYWYV